MKTVKKAYELYDAEISFISLVGKPANKRKFLTVKSEDKPDVLQVHGGGRILDMQSVSKGEADTHYVVGVVYEPDEADTDNEFMTGVEIEKAAHWYLKHGRLVDEQHNYVPNDECAVVESWIAHEDSNIGGQAVKKGTWLAKIEVSNDVFEKIESGEINGYSFAGLAKCGTVDVDLSDKKEGESDMETENNAPQQQETAKSSERGFLAKIAKALGFDREAEAIEKGNVRDIYERGVKADGFWRAFDALRSSLCYYNYHDDAYVYESDPEVLRDALKDFAEIITELLCEEPVEIEKAIRNDGICAVEKAGKKISSARMEKLLAAHKNLSDLVTELSDPEPEEENGEDDNNESNATNGEGGDGKTEKGGAATTEKEESAMNMSPEERSALIADIVKAMKEETSTAPATEPVSEPATTEVVKSEPATRDELQAMIDEAVAKATKEETPEPAFVASQEEIQKMVNQAVAKARGVSSALNEEQRTTEKQQTRGVFTGML